MVADAKIRDTDGDIVSTYCVSVSLLLIFIAVLTLHSQDPNGTTLKDIQQQLL